MKKITCLLATLIALSARAETHIVPMNCTITATAYVQNTVEKTNRDLVTIAAPVRVAITTQSLLATLAADSYTLGKYSYPVFPSGAKIVWLDYPDNIAASYFVVTDASGQILCDVSNLLTFTTEATANAVQNGKFSASTGLISGFTQQYVGAVSFDDTGAAGGTTKFYFSGMVKAVGSDKISRKTPGQYTEKWKATMNGAVGSGEIGGLPLYLSGKLAASGSANFALF